MQITITRPWRRITRHLSHIFLTEARTFMGLVLSDLQTSTLSHGSTLPHALGVSIRQQGADAFADGLDAAGRFDGFQ